MKISTSLLAGLTAGAILGAVVSVGASTGAISSLFSLVTGAENGVSVTNAYRLDGDKIKDGTVTSAEIKDQEVETADLQDGSITAVKLAPGVGGGDDLGNHTATKDLDLNGHKLINAAGISTTGLGVAGVARFQSGVAIQDGTQGAGKILGSDAQGNAAWRTEADPKVGTLANGKWCTSDGTKVNCVDDAPAGGAGTGADVPKQASNFDDAIAPGKYNVNNGSNPVGNAPVSGVGYWYLDVTQHFNGTTPNNGWTSQRAQSFYADDVWTRRLENGAWQPWFNTTALKWDRVEGRLGVDGGTNNVAVAWADNAATVNPTNLVALYRMPDGTVTTNPGTVSTVTQTAPYSACTAMGAGWTRISGFNQGFAFFANFPSDPAPTNGNAYVCDGWSGVNTCNGDPNLPGCRGTIRAATPAPTCNRCGNTGGGGGTPAVDTCTPSNFWDGSISRTCRAASNVTLLGKLIIQ